MSFKKILMISGLLLSQMFVLAKSDQISVGTDSLVRYIQEAYNTASLPADLDTLIHRYTLQRHSDSNKIDYYKTWNSIFQSAVNNAKRKQPNAAYLNDSIINGIIIRGFAGKKYGRFINGGGLVSWMGDFGLRVPLNIVL